MNIGNFAKISLDNLNFEVNVTEKKFYFREVDKRNIRNWKQAQNVAKKLFKEFQTLRTSSKIFFKYELKLGYIWKNREYYEMYLKLVEMPKLIWDLDIVGCSEYRNISSDNDFEMDIDVPSEKRVL